MADLKNTLSPRVYKLREKVLSTKPSICTERARYYTEVYDRNEEKPLIIRRALALRETLENMTIFIDDGELIVGNHSSKIKAAPFFPEYAVGWMVDELDSFEKRSGDAFYPTEEVKREIRELSAYWEGKTTVEKSYALMPEKYREIHDSGIIRAEGNMTSGDAHIAVSDEKILKIGLTGYIEEVRKYRAGLNLAFYEDLKKEQFYKAVEIALGAFRTFIRRFADLASEMSLTEKDPARKKELDTIAGNCRHISEYPPENFYQALQLVYFVQLVLQIESNGHSMSLGRMDQYLYPFFRQDKDAGMITGEFAMELLECTWVKLLAIRKIRPWSHTRFSAGGPLYQNVTIGGQTPDGIDAVNELSFLILRSVGYTRLTQPNLSVRFHRNISDEFLMEWRQVIELGFACLPSTDEIVIPGLMELGVEKEDAYNYSAIGCIEVAVPGKWGYRCTGMSFLNMARVLLAAINNGYDNMTGKTFRPGKGTLKDFTCFEQVMDAWKEQVKFYAEAVVAIDTAVDIVLEENVRILFPHGGRWQGERR